VVRETKRILRGGTVVDGTSRDPYRADVVIEGQVITEVAEARRLDGDAEAIDVGGLYILPGFIDCHSHGDLVVREPDVQEALLRQGVTSIICGQDGLSYIGAGKVGREFCRSYFGSILGEPDEELAAIKNVGEWLRFWHRRTQVNYGVLVPAGTVRADVVGLDERRATAGELAEMAARIRDGLAQGALGMSSGLEYVPGAFADETELGVLTSRVAARGGVYVTHMRGYEQMVPDAMKEVAEIARRSGVRVHISHYHGPAGMLSEELWKLREANVHVTFDSYPYLRSATTLAKVVLPLELQRGGVAETLERLRDLGVREWLERSWFPTIEERLPKVTLSFIGNEKLKKFEGLRLDRVLGPGVGGATALVELLVATELAVGCVFEYPASTTEADLRALARDDGHCGGSDGIYLGRCPHPRGWGTFARFVRRHCRELSDWSWSDVAVHLASRPATVFGLEDRGVIAEGKIADIVVLDPEGVRDIASYSSPREPAVGVIWVFVNGEMVVRGGRFVGTDVGPGGGAGVALRGSFAAGGGEAG